MWDELLRVGGSLKLGLLTASELVLTLRSGTGESSLTKALKEIGRIAKTLYLLAYIHDEAYRRRVLIQLNRSEARHRLARAIFFGRRGELRRRYRMGQEDQLGALGLVTNVVVLWNTIYVDAALRQLEGSQVLIEPEVVARLSPLGFQHIRFLGRYDFNLDEHVVAGQLRPIRDPFDPDCRLFS
jgi:TnpA family transposase